MLNSCVASPAQGEEVTLVAENQVVISGWAHGNGLKGTQAVKVELSFDEGETWTEAHEYLKENKAEGKKVFSWTLWKYTHALPADSPTESREISVHVRAVGSDGEVQETKLD